MDIDLKGKNVVVTGAARGIGREICGGFASNGSNVIGVDISDMSETGEYLNSLGEDIQWSEFKIDLSSPESIQKGCKKIQDSFPEVHALVNNAAYYAALKWAPMEELDLKEWDLVMNINIRGLYLTIRELLPALKAAKGKIINFASDAALRGGPFMLHYVASKGAVIGMTRALSTELGAYGITVNAVAPGLIDTPSSQSLGENYQELLGSVVQAQAIHEPMQPGDVVGTVLYLASSWGDAVTGQLCPVDRGLVKY